MKFLLLLLCPFALCAQTSVLQKKLSGIDAEMEKVRTQLYAPGFAVAVVDKNGLVWSKGYGLRDVEKNLPATPNTVYAIGSCTKAFTSALVGLLQRDGKVDFDKPANTYLPGVHYFNDALYDRITLRDMMSHRTGLPRHDFSWYLFQNASTDSLLQRLVYQEPTAGVRDRWQYNNFMFAAQGFVAEKLTGKTWEQNLQDSIFKPLSMVNTNTTINEWTKVAEPAVGYRIKGYGGRARMDYYNIAGMKAAGAINSSVNDIARWVQCWINGGKFDGKSILPAGYITQAISSQAIVGAGLPSKEKPDILFSNYGMGWFLASYKGHYRVEHGGNIDGFSASTSFFPTDSIGIIVLVNQDGSQVPATVRNIIADRLLNEKYFDWLADAVKSRNESWTAMRAARSGANASTKKGTKPSHALSDYEGDYKHPGYGTFQIQRRGDSLFANAGSRKLWLQHRHYDVFDLYQIDTETARPDTADGMLTIKLQFTMNREGDIDGLTLPFEAELKPIVFTKQLKTIAVAPDDLKKYVGDYSLGTATVKVYTKGNTLFVLVPGQPDYELVPVNKDKFALKVVSGFYVQFNVDGGTVKDLTFQQPNGNFKAVRK